MRWRLYINMRLIISFFSEMWRWAKSGFGISPRAIYRLSICFGCDYFQANSKRCQKCGCFMVAKTKMKSAKCPIDKW